MQPDEQEIALIRRAAAGEAAAMQHLLLKYRTRLLSYLDRHLPAALRRTIDSQDVLQETYIDAFRSIGSFQATDSRSAWQWLLTITRRRMLSLLRVQFAGRRGRGAVAKMPAGNTYDSVQLLLQDLALYERTPSQSAFAHELLGMFQQLLSRLPPEWAQAIRLRYMEGLSTADAGERMNRSPKAVMMLCTRALRRLRLEMRSVSHYL